MHDLEGLVCWMGHMSFNKSQKPKWQIERGIYEINGFQIRFTEKEIEELATAEGSTIDMYIHFGIQKLKWCIQDIA